MEIPSGYECQVRSRSGLALKQGLVVLNQPGTIDSTYRGQCNVILINTSDRIQEIKLGDRIAQFVFVPISKVKFKQVNSKEELSTSDRNSGGFGHTGV
jgi:dUTP pyrophosphatase